MSEAFKAIEDQLNTDLEKKVISFLAEKNTWTDIEIDRRSDAEWDFTINGRMVYKYTSAGLDDATVKFSAGPKLALIREAPWTSYGKMSDYQMMVEEAGDWSGIRDSSVESRDVMFEASLEDLGLADTPRPGLR